MILLKSNKKTVMFYIAVIYFFIFSSFQYGFQEWSITFKIINLQHIYSIRYTEKSAVVDEEDPEDSGWIFKQIKMRFVQFYVYVYIIILYIILKKNQPIY